MREPAGQQPEEEEEPMQILVLDKNPDEPLWILATAVPVGAWLARLDSSGECQNWPAVVAWVEYTIKNTADLVPLHDALAWHVRGVPHLPSTTVLGLVPVPGLPESVRLIVSVRKDGQSTAAGVLVSGNYKEEALEDANALAGRLGISPVGHWRMTGAFDCPEFYAAEAAGAMSWPALLVDHGINPEDEDAIAAILNAD